MDSRLNDSDFISAVKSGIASINFLLKQFKIDEVCDEVCTEDISHEMDFRPTRQKRIACVTSMETLISKSEKLKEKLRKLCTANSKQLCVLDMHTRNIMQKAESDPNSCDWELVQEFHEYSS